MNAIHGQAPEMPNLAPLASLAEYAQRRWPGAVEAAVDAERCRIDVRSEPAALRDVVRWLFRDLQHTFAGLVVEDRDAAPILHYLFYGDGAQAEIHVATSADGRAAVPTIADIAHAADWHEREVEDLFGLQFEGHPRLGDFVLHNDIWPENVGLMRTDFDPERGAPRDEPDAGWRPLQLVEAPGAFLMPVGPIYSGIAESALFLLETVGEDVIRAFPRLFYKYRAVEKIAEGRSVDDALLLAERFAATSAFAHSLAFCQAVEAMAHVDVPPRARALRILLAELERLRHHLGAIEGICESTALAVATSQAAIMEEELLRLCGAVAGHRYLFGLNVPGGLSREIGDDACRAVAQRVAGLLPRLRGLRDMLRFSSSFLDRLEGIGVVSRQQALDHGLVGPVARASDVARDLRAAQPYTGYDRLDVAVPHEREGDGYARLLVLFAEAEAAASIVQHCAAALPAGPVRARPAAITAGIGLGWAEAPLGAAFHWVRVGDEGRVLRYRVMPPSFTNWHGFHLAAEGFAFQDFPIILATFGLSVAECDR